MKKAFSKSLSWLLSVVMIFGFFVVPSVSVSATQSASGGFSRDYTLTGDGFTDMVNIAMAQNEKTQAQIGYSESWCANFVSDCARLAGQESAVPFNGVVQSMYNAVINAGGYHVSSPQAGDLVFFTNGSGYGHVGIALDSDRNISGNIWYGGNPPSKVMILKNSWEGFSSWNYVRPNYQNTPISYNPEGHLDGVNSPEAGKLHVAGWAFDRDDVNASLGIHIYVGGTFVGEISAWKGRADVNGSFPGVGDYHGFEETIDIWQSGTQNVEVYALNVGGGTNILIGSATVNIAEKPSDIYVPVIQEAYVDNVTSYSFRLNAKVSDNVGVSKVEFETWKDGSPLRKTYTVQSIGNDMYIYDVNISDLTDEAGVYHSIVHAYDPSNNHSTAEIYIIVPDKDTIAPTISDVTFSQVSANGYRITCKISDNVGVTSVKFPTWGGGDFKWLDGEVNGDVATCYINTSDFNNEIGDYANHIYAYDAAGNSNSTSAGYIYVSDEPIEISSMTYGEHKYIVYNSGLSWTKAKAWCENNGGYLATITSEAEWNKVSELLKSYNGVRCWLGAESTNGSWKWITGEPLTYTKWGGGQPDCNGNVEFYLGTYGGEVYDNYVWNDFTDDGVLISGFVFEKVEHQYEEKVIAPTCTEKGYTLHTCSKCGDSYKDTYTNATGHNYEETIVAPTTTEQGYTLHTCSVCKHSYKGNYTNILLSNNSTLSAETIKLGETITATAKATGGTGEYLYQVVYKQTTQSKWTTAQSYKANSIVTFKPANAVTYDVCVKVKDSNNTEVKKFFTVKVTSDELKNVSTISAQTINLGSTVTINAKATGSTGFYTYAVYYKQKAQTKWTTKQDFKANNTVSVKPAKATTYDICVKVKDDKGTIVKKYFTVNVTDFKNTSTLSATEIKLGSTVKVSCSATGSTGYYQYAVYYKKTSDTKWTTKQNYSLNNTVTIKPAKATTYDVCVKVKDNQNNEVKKYFNVTVK